MKHCFFDGHNSSVLKCTLHNCVCVCVSFDVVGLINVLSV